MKVAFLADLHLGHLYGNPRERERWEDSFRSLEEAVEIANKRADLIVIAGDVFDKKAPSVHVLIRAVRLFRKAKVPIFAIHGNHDVRAGDRENTLALLDSAGVLKYVHNEKVVFEKNGEKITIQGVGWVPDDLAPSFFLSEVPDGKGGILVAHQSLEGFYPYDDETPLPMEALPEGYELYVFGHMHWFAEKDVHGKRILLPGSTVVTQLREKELLGQKYVCIYDTLAKTIEKIPLKSTRPGHVVEIDVTGKDQKEVVAQLCEKIEPLCGDPLPIVKVIVKGVAKEFFNFEPVLRRFEGKAIVKIFDRTYQSIVEEVLELKRKYKEDSETFSEKYALKLLKEHVKKAGIECGNIDELFEALKCGDADRALSIVLGQGRAKNPL